MILELELQPRTVHERPRLCTWEVEAGTFEGPDADTIRELCETYADIGTVVTDPYPTSYPCTDPFHNPAHLAAVLSTRWRLPEELARYLPEPAIEKEGLTRVLY